MMFKLITVKIKTINQYKERVQNKRALNLTHLRKLRGSQQSSKLIVQQVWYGPINGTQIIKGHIKKMF